MLVVKCLLGRRVLAIFARLSIGALYCGVVRIIRIVATRYEASSRGRSSIVHIISGLYCNYLMSENASVKNSNNDDSVMSVCRRELCRIERMRSETFFLSTFFLYSRMDTDSSSVNTELRYNEPS